MIDAIGSSTSVSSIYPLGGTGDNEQAERVPDNEAAEIAVKAPLFDYQGQTIDIEA
ncbi:MAG: hypothetical protein RBT68_05635 [Spirochaetia bacterium]|jgi:hypothetical protein|nr:hypothetical protein [Spirochaetia bacterium]